MKEYLIEEVDGGFSVNDDLVPNRLVFIIRYDDISTQFPMYRREVPGLIKFLQEYLKGDTVA